MAANKKEVKKKVGVQEWMYEIIRAPHVTEKATMGSEHGHVTFRVPLCATKPQIKQAVETVFNVKVKGVNTLILKGKTKRFRADQGKRGDMKKAIVTLEEGHNIDVGTGV
ncbi:MAG TPA: 50S ribosomal protein L23 [Rhodospirillaceae bacterium]|nr:50S ribosomal protein L23 [Rhodospirillaceae bacterium]